MSELSEKVKTSIERLKAFEPEEGYYLAFSGGKDSVVCKALMDTESRSRCGISFRGRCTRRQEWLGTAAKISKRAAETDG